MSIRSILIPFREEKPFAITALALLFIPIVFSRFTFEKFDTIKFVVLYILFGLALIFLARQFAIRFNKIVTWLLVGIGIASFSATIFSDDKLFSLFGRSSYWTGALFMVIWCVFLFVLISLLNQKRFEQILNILIVGGLVNAVLSVLQAFSIGYYESPYTIGYLLRPPALFGNPNYTSMFLASMALVAIYQAFNAKTLALKNYFFVAAFAMVFATMILSSRGASLGLMAGLLVVFVLSLIVEQYKFARVVIAWGILAGVLFAVISPPFRATYTGTGTFDTSEENVITRLAMWDQGWQILEQDPLSGIGFGNLSGASHDAHNLFLNLGIAGGLPLMLLFLALIIFAAVIGLRGIKNSQFNIILLGCLASFLIASSFNPVTLPNFILLAVLLAGLFYSQANNEVTIDQPLKLSVTFTGILVMLLGISLVGGQAFLYLALKANIQKNDYQNAEKYVAISKIFDPWNDLTAQQAAGLKVYTKADLSDTIRSIEYYEKLHSKDPEVILRAGRLYYQLYRQSKKQEHFDLAVKKIAQAVKANPRISNGYFFLAYYYYAQGNLVLAKQTINNGLVEVPNDALLWTLSANIHLGEHNREKAKASVEALYKLDVKNKILKHMLEAFAAGQNVSMIPLAVPDNPYIDPYVVPVASL